MSRRIFFFWFLIIIVCDTFLTMKKNTVITIAALSVEIVSDCREIADFCKARYRDFISEEKPDLSVEIAYADAVDLTGFLDVPSEKLTVFTDPKSRTYTKKELLMGQPDITHLADRILALRYDFAGTLLMSEKKAKLVLKKKQAHSSLDSFLRVCFSTLVIQKGGLMLHAAGIDKGTKGYVFFGVSRTGKTTIANFSKGHASILSDEFVFVIKSGEAYRVFGSPFYGTYHKYGINSDSPVTAAFNPVKDSDICIKKINPVTFLSKFLAAAVVFTKNPGDVDKVLEIAHDFVNTVPCFDLHFEKNDRFWTDIDALEL